MNKVFIISTRSMLAPHCFLQVPPCSYETISLDSPFVNFLMGEAGMPGFLMDVHDDEDGTFPDELKEHVRGIVPEGLFDNPDELKRWLKDDGGADIIDSSFHDVWRTYELGELLPVVKGLSWNTCLRFNGDGISVAAVQHLPVGPGSVRKHKDSTGWVDALLNTFASPGQEVCMILHDRDLDGYENRPYYLLSHTEVKEYTLRDHVQIIVFTHSDNPVTHCLAENNPEAFLSGITALPERLEALQRKNSLMDNL